VGVVVIGEGGEAIGAEPGVLVHATRRTRTSATRRTRLMLRERHRPPGTIPSVTEWDLSPKPVSASQVTLVQLMEITDANIGGIVHGGVIMKLVDTAAGLASIKHAGGLCVTVTMDEMSFLAPVHVGDTVTVKASVNDVGNTSIEVGVRVESEEIVSGRRTHTSSAYLVFVAIDDDGRPRPVPAIVAETPDQERRQREAKIRRETRLAHRKLIEEHRLRL
jgi:uncharacterized protein (TIGR00369 family)